MPPSLTALIAGQLTMQTTFLMGILAGLVSVLLFGAAVMAPDIARLFLLLMTPLPVAYVGLKADWKAALAANAAAFGGLALVANPQTATIFVVMMTLPVTFLAYLAVLHRETPATGDTPSHTEWYPLGRLVVWAALIGSALALLSLLLSLGPDLATLKTNLRAALQPFIEEYNRQANVFRAPSLTPEDLDGLTTIVLNLLPAVMAMFLTGTLLLNLWLAARMLRAFERAPRPWPDFAAVVFPPGTPLLFAIAMGAMLFLTEMPRFVATAFWGGLFFAYLLMGLAITHFVTRGASARGLFLWLLYLALFFLGQIVGPILAIVGLLDSLIPLRRLATPPPGSPPASRPSSP